MSREQDTRGSKFIRGVLIGAAIVAGGELVASEAQQYAQGTTVIGQETPVVLSNGNEFSPLPGNPENYYLKGPATISENAFLQVLADNGSPMSQETAQQVYKMLKDKGFNPAVFLAIMGQESGYGKNGIARKTLSACNIRPWIGAKEDPKLRIVGDPGNQFVDFSKFGDSPKNAKIDGYDGWWHSFDACSNNADALLGRVNNNLVAFIRVETPPSDGNDTDGYIQRVKAAMKEYENLSVQLKKKADAPHVLLTYPLTVDGMTVPEYIAASRRAASKE